MTPQFPIPTAVKRYVAILNQVNTAAPTITELVNTTGETPSTIRNASGIYELNWTNPILKESKTTIQLGPPTARTATIAAYWSTEQQIAIETASSFAYSDNILYDTTIEINIYQ